MSDVPPKWCGLVSALARPMLSRGRAAYCVCVASDRCPAPCVGAPCVGAGAQRKCISAPARPPRSSQPAFSVLLFCFVFFCSPLAYYSTSFVAIPAALPESNPSNRSTHSALPTRSAAPQLARWTRRSYRACAPRAHASPRLVRPARTKADAASTIVPVEWRVAPQQQYLIPFSHVPGVTPVVRAAPTVKV
ncbi:MAG: hypothetical protein J3K34DRAFT_400998, partial [Monoraphidium minutum]